MGDNRRLNEKRKENPIGLSEPAFGSTATACEKRAQTLHEFLDRKGLGCPNTKVFKYRLCKYIQLM
jgi:hypothetical protein